MTGDHITAEPGRMRCGRCGTSYFVAPNRFGRPDVRVSWFFREHVDCPPAALPARVLLALCTVFAVSFGVGVWL